MTITEFLLARIREDEAVAARAGEVRPELWPDDREPWADPYMVEVRMSPIRVLAECAAKRRIIESFNFSDEPKSAVDYVMDAQTRMPNLRPNDSITTLIYVAKCMASVYADHPDFNPEWILA